jgi:antitoxin (DNA-binding transcriptional repressor) of toxin-antitoxin stability system
VARVTPLDENDNQIFTVNIPPSENGLQAGDEVEILVHGKRAAAITWFD